MLGNLKSNFVKYVGPLGGYRIARYLTRYQPKILMFHRFSECSDGGYIGQSLFEQQVVKLKKEVNVVPLTTAVKAIRGEIPIQKNMVVLTIDDGYDDFYKYAYPILKKYDLPATLYATVDFIDQKLWLWPDILTYVLKETSCELHVFVEKDSEQTYDLTKKQDKDKLWTDMVDYCLSVSNEDKNTFLDKIPTDLKVKVPPLPTDEYSAADWAELKEMAVNGIEIGAHTSTHPALSKVHVDNLDYEVARCKDYMQNMLGVEVNNYCYPNGQPGDYNEYVKEAVMTAGFLSATVAFADDNPYKDYYELRRHAVGNDMFQFLKVINGVELLGFKLKKMLA